ncbi:MAG: Crp/Fnr family transcriptional regulator [Chitinophagaceae bacterium]
MTIDNKLLLIRNHNIFACMTDEDYEEMNIIHNFIEAAKGEYIYFDSHFHNKLYFVKGGNIKIGYYDEEGNEVVKEIIRQGETFGQITLERNNLNGEFAKAYKGDVSLCAFNIEDFEKLLKQKPDVSLRFTRQIGHQLRNVENRLVNVLNKDVKTRLIIFLLYLAKEHIATAATDAFCIPNHLTHEDIASLIGSSRQTVTTLVSELAAQEMISVNRQQICFLNVKELKKHLTVG